MVIIVNYAADTCARVHLRTSAHAHTQIMYTVLNVNEIVLKTI